MVIARRTFYATCQGQEHAHMHVYARFHMGASREQTSYKSYTHMGIHRWARRRYRGYLRCFRGEGKARTGQISAGGSPCRASATDL